MPQEVFEHVYEEFKYRHQDEGFQTIPTPGRTETSLRREDKRAKKRREAKAQREKEMKQTFQQDLSRAKQLKKQEMEKKATVLKEIAGVPPGGLCGPEDRGLAGRREATNATTLLLRLGDT